MIQGEWKHLETKNNVP